MSNPSDQQPNDGILRISRDEAMSAHVDDLLKRQMSLRGETAVTRDRGRHWYYQNWFVFLAAGALAAIAAWAILEPFFDDRLYFQGKIEAVDRDASLPSPVRIGNQEFKLHAPVQGTITIRGQTIWLVKGASWYDGKHKPRPVDIADLEPGQETGVYVEYLGAGSESLAFATFLRPSPPKQKLAEARLTLSQLHSRTVAAGLLLFATVAGLVGLAIGAVDGAICRLARRALLAGSVGLLVGFIGGFVSSILAGLAYSPLNRLAADQWDPTRHTLTTFGFVIQMTGRSLAWCLAGMAMGLGQGIALRSKRLLLYGFVGGLVGGLLGGLLFDPIDLILLGSDKPSAHWSRLIGFAVVGGSVGFMIGLVELLARDAWLRMTEGPLAGKEFLVFKDIMDIGASPRSEIYLFNDPLVQAHHATLRALGDECEIEAATPIGPLLLNGRPVKRSRLRHGDQITIGRTVFVFQKRKG
jgi:hypothetical protein